MLKKALCVAVFLVSALNLSALMAQPEENALLIDNRSPAEYAQGHVEGALLIPYDAIEAGILKLPEEKNTPIYLYCGSGGRAEIARKNLEHRGYTRVINLGGMAEAEAFWQQGEAAH